MKKSKYYEMVENENEADIFIFGDICEWAWESYGEKSATMFINEFNALQSDAVNVHINSYGGEVKEGLAIHNLLKQSNKKIKTFCDGFACSIASVIFMAGDERFMNAASLLMIHNPWTYTTGNAEEMRKQADDLDKIGKASQNAYIERINISEEKLKELLNEETWITPEEAVEMGFATNIVERDEEEAFSQSARESIFKILKHEQIEKNENEMMQKMEAIEKKLKAIDKKVSVKNESEGSGNVEISEEGKIKEKLFMKYLKALVK
ncbi:MAG: Clp protease ClpP [Eubacterium sp.]